MLVGVRPTLTAGTVPGATERMLPGTPETPNTSSSSRRRRSNWPNSVSGYDIIDSYMRSPPVVGEHRPENRSPPAHPQIWEPRGAVSRGRRGSARFALAADGSDPADRLAQRRLAAVVDAAGARDAHAQLVGGPHLGIADAAD